MALINLDDQADNDDNTGINPKAFDVKNIDFRGISFLPNMKTFILTDRNRSGRPVFQFVDLEPAIRVRGSAIGGGQRGKEISTSRYFNDPGSKNFNKNWRSKPENLFATQLGCSSENCWMIAPTFSNRHLLVFGMGTPPKAVPLQAAQSE